MPEQAETGDIGAGVNVPSNWLKLLQKRVLACDHVFDRSIQICSLGGTAHGSCKKYPGA